MYLALFLLGLVVTAIGLVTVGFGIPINAFSIGNTLIVAGATLVAAGLTLIGLAVVVRQLQRVASLLAARPAPQPARFAEPAEPVMATAKLAPAVSVSNLATHAEAESTRSIEPRAPEPRVAEPQLSDAAPTPSAPPTKGPLDWLRPKSKATSVEPPVVELVDDAPLSPRQPARTAAPEPSEPKVWSPARDDVTSAEPSSPPPEPRAERAERTARGPSPSERPKDTGLFDVAWPDPKSAPAPSETAQHEAPPRPRSQPMAERRSTVPSPDRSPAILKSGVIDGMAYTLYADGSIEAELPQGTLNFASVDELRAHLEKHGG